MTIRIRELTIKASLTDNNEKKEQPVAKEQLSVNSILQNFYGNSLSNTKVER